MRGTPDTIDHIPNAVGIIPAYAGNTHTQIENELLRGDHPRVCGEHRLIGGRRRGAVGSSPRMRGTRMLHADGREVRGIIPAYAGNTRGHVGVANENADHPRVCGEHLRVWPHSCGEWGSSPRMRGTLQPQLLVRPRPGIIPAYAGNTRRVPLISPPRWDHPRVCGEHEYSMLSGDAAAGSSPRMRGTPIRAS